MSLANVLAVSQAARSVVLLGDPQQLDSPCRAVIPKARMFPLSTTSWGFIRRIPIDRGLFLEETWRLHPDICAFTSELFYESRLRSRQAWIATNKVDGSISGSGLRFLPVAHEGNQSSCPEEADTIRGLVAEAPWVQSHLD